MELVMSSLVVNDGFTFNGEIQEFPGLHPGLTFKFRPCVMSERRKHANSPDSDAADAEIILTHTSDWRAVRKGKPDEPVTLTASTNVGVDKEVIIKKMHANLVQGLLNYALGFAGEKVLEDAEGNSSAG